MGVRYALREELASGPDIKSTAYAGSKLDAVLESSSRDIDNLLHWRTIAPLMASKSWDYPNTQRAESGRLWLDDWPLYSFSSFSSGGTSIPIGSVRLEPNRSGPPYRSIVIDRLSSYVLSSGSTSGQQALTLAGTFALSNAEEPAGTCSALTSSATTLTASTAVGTGALLRIGSEYVIVTGRANVSSGQTATLAAQNNATVLTVSDGSVFTVGESLTIDGERVMVNDIAGNTLIIQRAMDGTTLAAHTAALIYWPRQLTVTRGQQGSTAASHGAGSAMVRWVPPAPINELCLAMAADRYFQRGSGYARTIGSGEGERAFSGRPIAALRDDVMALYGRNARIRAV